jgi:hypothetical protein
MLTDKEIILLDIGRRPIVSRLIKIIKRA